MGIFKAAAIQMRSGREPGRNVVDFEALVREAAGKGATYVQTPEMTGALIRHKADRALAFTAEEKDAVVAAARRLSAELGIFLHVGSTAILRPDGKIANRSFLFAPDGALVARYDKIHMFDVDLDNGESWRESATYEPGHGGAGGRHRRRKTRLRHLLRRSLSCNFSAPRRWLAPRCSPCPPPSPARLARRTGTSFCAPAPSRTAPS